jgi:hypothetical protein
MVVTIARPPTITPKAVDAINAKMAKLVKNRIMPR